MKHSNSTARPKLAKRLIIVVGLVVLLFAALIGFNTFKGIMIGKFMQSMANPPQTVSTMQAKYLAWQPKLEAFGNVRAAQGADLAFDVSGIVDGVKVASGADVKAGQVLIELVDDQDRATLDALRAKAHLAELTVQRAKQQRAIQAISQAAYDEVVANLRTARAQAEAQAALVAKKTLRAPFAGRIGIVTANAGQYLNAGTAVVTLQQLDPVYVDFHLAQASLEHLHVGSAVEVTADGFGNRVFTGTVSAIAPVIDVDTRNIRVEAKLANPDRLLIPGMFTHVAVANGQPESHLTLPQTAITYAPYGDTVFVVREGAPPAATKTKPGEDQGKDVVPSAHAATGGDDDHAPSRYVEQVLVNTGATRGDQVAVLSGIQPGDVIVTSGQLKLKNGTPVHINNAVQPAFDANPQPLER